MAGAVLVELYSVKELSGQRRLRLTKALSVPVCLKDKESTIGGLSLSGPQHFRKQMRCVPALEQFKLAVCYWL